ncbi:MAG: hypothetical protein ACOYEB_07355 [Enterococcus lemanii]|jgi:hypothetical protein
MRLFYFVNAPSGSGRTQRRLCFEKTFPDNASQEEIDAWIAKLQNFAKPRYYHNPPVDELSKSFKAVACGDLSGIGNYTVYKFANEPTLYINIYGVWWETFELVENAWFFATHEESGRYCQVFTTLDGIEWLNIGTIRRPRYIDGEDILRNIYDE